MSAVKELIRTEADGTLSFGDYELAAKAKLPDYEHQGDLYKVKTFQEITKLEKNGMFVYESVPGTAVLNFKEMEDGVYFLVEGRDGAQITIGAEEDTEYAITMNGEQADQQMTRMGGKIVLSVAFDEDAPIEIAIKKLV